MFRRMMVLAGLTAAGCSASADFNPVGKNTQDMSPTQLAAFAAKATYPTETQPSTDLRAAAIVSRSNGTIKIYNFTDHPIRDAKVWVNKAFVTRIDGIPPLSRVTVQTSKLYGPFGNALASEKDSVVSQVQLQTADGLYSLQGPVQE